MCAGKHDDRELRRAEHDAQYLTIFTHYLFPTRDDSRSMTKLRDVISAYVPDIGGKSHFKDRQSPTLIISPIAYASICSIREIISEAI